MLEIRTFRSKRKGIRVDLLRKYKYADPKNGKIKFSFKQIGSFLLEESYEPELLELLQPEEVLQLKNWLAEAGFAKQLGIEADNLSKFTIRMPQNLYDAVARLYIECKRVNIEFIPNQILLNALIKAAINAQREIDKINNFNSNILQNFGIGLHPIIDKDFNTANHTEVLPPNLIEKVLKSIECHKSAFNENDLRKAIEPYITSVEQFLKVLTQIKASNELVYLGAGDDGRDRFTTRRILETERKIVKLGKAMHQSHALFKALLSLNQPIGKTCTELEEAAKHYGKNKRIPPPQLKEWAGELPTRNPNKVIKKWAYAIAIDVLLMHHINPITIEEPKIIAEYWAMQKQKLFNLTEAIEVFIRIFNVPKKMQVNVKQAITNIYAISSYSDK